MESFKLSNEELKHMTFDYTQISPIIQEGSKMSFTFSENANFILLQDVFLKCDFKFNNLECTELDLATLNNNWFPHFFKEIILKVNGQVFETISNPGETDDLIKSISLNRGEGDVYGWIPEDYNDRNQSFKERYLLYNSHWREDDSDLIVYTSSILFNLKSLFGLFNIQRMVNGLLFELVFEKKDMGTTGANFLFNSFDYVLKQQINLELLDTKLYVPIVRIKPELLSNSMFCQGQASDEVYVYKRYDFDFKINDGVQIHCVPFKNEGEAVFALFSFKAANNNYIIKKGINNLKITITGTPINYDINLKNFEASDSPLFYKNYSDLAKRNYDVSNPAFPFLTFKYYYPFVCVDLKKISVGELNNFCVSCQSGLDYKLSCVYFVKEAYNIELSNGIMTNFCKNINLKLELLKLTI